MLGFLIRASIVALGLWLATVWVNGVSIDTPATLILAGVLLVWPFVLDAGFTFAKRLARRERVFEAHRSHIYQGFIDRGASHAAITLARTPPMVIAQI